MSLEAMDEKFMREALRQARKGLGLTSPNPAVGAVIVRDGRIIASGYHKKAGEKHAEIEALGKIGGKAGPGDVLYVTLEPCNHYGKTPPCTEAIVKGGLKKLVVGMRDPNPRVSGGGCEYLARSGVDIKTGILEEACRQLNEPFLKFIVTGRPFVMVKTALTLDGWTATSTGHSKWITNDKSREFVHRLRDQVDGIMVGVGTVVADDPFLTTRLKRRKGKDAIRIVVDSHLRIPEEARVLHSGSSSTTLIVAGSDVPAERKERFQKEGVSVITCPTRNGLVDLGALMDILGGRDMTSILVEGGATLIGSMIRQRLVDKFFVFKAPKILGGDNGIPMASGPGPKRMDECLTLRDARVRRFDDDLLITGYPVYPPQPAVIMKDSCQQTPGPQK